MYRRRGAVVPRSRDHLIDHAYQPWAQREDLADHVQVALDIIFDSARLVRDSGAQETWSTCNGTVVPVCRRQFQ